MSAKAIPAELHHIPASLRLGTALAHNLLKTRHHSRRLSNLPQIQILVGALCKTLYSYTDAKRAQKSARPTHSTNTHSTHTKMLLQHECVCRRLDMFATKH